MVHHEGREGTPPGAVSYSLNGDMDTLFAAPIGALIIFLLRVVDVSMATVRMIVIVRGQRAVAAAIGFVEILIWLMAAGHALQHLDSILHVLGYAGGFSAGTYAGVWLENKFGFGISVIRAVFELDTPEPSSDGPLLESLRDAGYGVTEVVGRGRNGPVEILNIVVDRRKVPDVLTLINTHAPATFVTIEEIQTTFGGFIHPAGRKWPFLEGAMRVSPSNLKPPGSDDQPH